MLTSFLMLAGLASPSEFDLRASGLPMVGQELTLVVEAPAGTPFRLHSGEGSFFGVTGDEGHWRRTFRPVTAGDALFRAEGRAADGQVVRDDLALSIRDAYRPGSGDVVISEVDRRGGWIELFNRTPYDLDLADWTLRDDGGDLQVIGHRILPARAYLVLAAGAGFVLDADADEVVLTDTEGRELDRVAYDVRAGWPAAKVGESLSIASASATAGGPGQAGTSVAQERAGGLGFCGAPSTPGIANLCCASVKGASDVPDLDFVDSNCDGIDGDVSRALFVSASGTFYNAGTMQEPLDTIQNALVLAALDPTVDHVYVSEGTYAGPLVLVDGISIWGGFSEANGWQRSGTYVTTIRADVPSAEGMVGVRGTGLQLPLTLGSVRIETADAAADSSFHNYGVLLQSSPDVTFEGVVVVAGAGGSGKDGAKGAAGTGGKTGEAGYTDGTGGGWTYGAGSTGGKGGQGGNGNGYNGYNGYGIAFGTYGAGGTWIGAGLDGKGGGGGVWGTDGWWPSNAAYQVGGKLLVLGTGGWGGQGPHGSGGGGGGGGSGNFFGTTGCGGGSGGSGGGGGGGGQPGAPGGASLALFLHATGARLDGCALFAGTGGIGGDSGVPGNGGLGGAGGAGAVVSGLASGGNGGKGGNGGRGGWGAGGAGGHSFGVALDSLSTLSQQGSSITAGSASGGGYPSSNLFGEAVAIKQL